MTIFNRHSQVKASSKEIEEFKRKKKNSREAVFEQLLIDLTETYGEFLGHSVESEKKNKLGPIHS